MVMNTDNAKRTDGFEMPRRRRTYTVNPAFQWKYTLMTVATVFVSTAFITIMLYNALYQQARGRMMTPAAVSGVDNLTMIILAATAFTVVVGGALAISVFVFTHRIAGPMHVVGRALEQLAAGKVPTMRPLRRTDEFKDVHDALCQVVDRVREERGQAVESLTELYNLAQTIGAGSSDDTKVLCDDLLTRLERERNDAIAALGDPEGGQTTTSLSDVADPAPSMAGATVG